MDSLDQKKDYNKAYKAYDIRGIYGEHIDDIFAYNIGLGLGKEAIQRDGDGAKILIGSDVREHNNTFIYRLIVGLKEAGVQSITNAGIPVEAIDNQQQIRGVCSTSMMYYFTQGSFTFGIPVTASHNPPEYVGMKIVDHNAELIETSILKSYVGETYKALPHNFDQEQCDKFIQALHTSKEKTIIENKYKTILTLLESYCAKTGAGSTIVIDYSNGASIAYERQILHHLCEKYNQKLIEINTLADSQFGAHLSDTTNYDEYKQLQATVIEHDADIGFMFDGDADRIGIVDEQGNIISGDITVAAIAEWYLQQSPKGSSVVYDITSSNCIVDMIKKYDGIPVVSRVGHRFVKEKYKESNAVFAGELSGHLFFKELGGFESTIMPIIIMLLERQYYKTMSNLQNSIMKYYKPAIINFKVTNTLGAIETIKETFKNHNQDYTDGVRINAEKWRFVVRPSNTEPVIRFYAEAENKEKYEEIKGTIEEILYHS